MNYKNILTESLILLGTSTIVAGVASSYSKKYKKDKKAFKSGILRGITLASLSVTALSIATLNKAIPSATVILSPKK